VESSALVAVNEQVPYFVAVNVDPLNEQPVAVPSVTASVTDPLPEPPLVERVKDCEYG
jgi:hypothetical protein